MFYYVGYYGNPFIDSVLDLRNIDIMVWIQIKATYSYNTISGILLLENMVFKRLEPKVFSSRRLVSEVSGIVSIT